MQLFCIFLDFCIIMLFEFDAKEKENRSRGRGLICFERESLKFFKQRQRRERERERTTEGLYLSKSRGMDYGGTEFLSLNFRCFLCPSSCWRFV